MDPNTQQPQQSVNLQPAQPPVQPQMTKSSSLQKVLLRALGVIIVLGLIGGAYYLGTQKKSSTTSDEKVAVSIPTKIITTISPNSPTPTPDVTANWKSYTATDNSYSLKYPNDGNWKLTEVNGNGFANVDVQCPHLSCPKPYNIYDFVGGTASTLPNSIGSYISSLNTTNPTVNTNASPYIHDYQKIKVNGLDAVETLAQTGNLAGSGPIVTVFFISKAKSYSYGYTYTDVNLDTITKLSQLPKPNPDFFLHFNSQNN